MRIAKLAGVELEYETSGCGEPVLLIDPVLPGGFLPFFGSPALVDRYRLIRYHKRGWCGSTHTAPPATIADHAADAAGLLDALGLRRAHVAGHSTGGAIALQLAVARPDLVHSLTLLEPSLFTVPGTQPLFEKAAAALEAYGAGDHERAVACFLRVVSGLEWITCRAAIDAKVPDGVARLVSDAATMFGGELPAVAAWEFGSEQAATISQPVLSILGGNTDRLWVEVADLLRTWFPQVEELHVEGVGHLLHIERTEPVVLGVAAFLRRHPMPAAERAGSHAVSRPVAAGR